MQSGNLKRYHIILLGLAIGLLAGCGSSQEEISGLSGVYGTGAETAGIEADEMAVLGDESASSSPEEGDETAGSTESGEDVAGNASPQDKDKATEVTPTTVSILMAGDMLLHTRVEESALTADGSYDYEAVFANVADTIAQADIAIANQEVIIGGSELGISGYPAFNAPYEFADALVDVGFDVACQGTNHALDKGGRGITNCLDYWADNYPNMGVLGIHDSYEDQEEIYYTTVNGITVAILNYTYGTNGISLPSDMPYAVDYLSQDRVVSDLQEAEENADFTIVCPHWGTEYQLTEDSSQKKWAQIFTENGADLIIGTHPHVIEPIEWVEVPNGNTALCYYSLGNFVNWTGGEGQGVANRMVGGLAEVTIGKMTDGSVRIADYDAEALVSHVTSGTKGVTVYKLSEYTEELAQANEIRKQDGQFSLEYCHNLVSQVWGK